MAKKSMYCEKEQEEYRILQKNNVLPTKTRWLTNWEENIGKGENKKQKITFSNEKTEKKRDFYYFSLLIFVTNGIANDENSID